MQPDITRSEQLALEFDTLAGQKAPNDLDALAHREGRPYPLNAQLFEVRSARSESENSPPGAQLVERGDGRRDERGVLRVRLGNEGPELDTLGVQRRHGQPDQHVAVQLVVGVPDLVEALLLGQPNQHAEALACQSLPQSDAESRLTQSAASYPLLLRAIEGEESGGEGQVGLTSAIEVGLIY